MSRLRFRLWLNLPYEYEFYVFYNSLTNKRLIAFRSLCATHVSFMISLRSACCIGTLRNFCCRHLFKTLYWWIYSKILSEVLFRWKKFCRNYFRVFHFSVSTFQWIFAVNNLQPCVIRMTCEERLSSQADRSRNSLAICF